LNTSSINIGEKELIALYTVDYFVALFDVCTHFTATGTEILDRQGYRDAAWFKSLFVAVRPAARLVFSDYFMDRQNFGCKILKVLTCASDEEIASLSSRETVAMFCAADNILAASYHEQILYQQCQTLSKQLPSSKERRAKIQELQWVASKFRRLKKSFIRIVSQDSLDDISLSQSTGYETLVAAPVVYRNCPRQLAADWLRITKLRKKYSRSIYECEARLEIPGLTFTAKTNGKF